VPYTKGGAAPILRPVHTHFGSATFGAAAFLSMILFGTLWRLGWMHALDSPRTWLRKLAGAALFQY
jgi:hypothetical protein